MKFRRYLWMAALPAWAMQAQYTGKVGGGAAKPVLRATAVYEYTGALAKPNASRLVPVVVWDGVNYQPGGLYLARPEPLAIAPGTQYVLQQGGLPQGYFNVSSAARLSTGGWVGLGRFQAEAPPPAQAKLKPSKTKPVLTGGSGKGKAEPDADSEDRPTLKKKADTPPPASPTEDSSGANGGPTLHKRNTPDAGTAQADPDQPTLHRNSTSSASPEPDPDRPTLHRKDTADTGTAPDRPTLGKDSAASAPDPDRPTLHKHADAAAATVTAPDPDRPHLRYGAGPAGLAGVADQGRVEPALLEDKSKPGLPTTAAPVPVADAVAVSDTVSEDPHPYLYTWPDPKAQADAQTAMHALALRALASAAQATFGPAAKTDAALRKAADAAQASFGPGAKAAGARTPVRKRADAAPLAADPLMDAQLRALELSYGAGATYVYSAHTAEEGPARRYVTVIAQPDFYGKPQVVFSQTTRGELLNETPALQLIDAVDADGDHRAELLFSRETQGSLANPAGARQFALYTVIGGHARLLYATE